MGTAEAHCAMQYAIGVLNNKDVSGRLSMAKIMIYFRISDSLLAPFSESVCLRSVSLGALFGVSWQPLAPDGLWTPPGWIWVDIWGVIWVSLLMFQGYGGILEVPIC